MLGRHAAAMVLRMRMMLAAAFALCACGDNLAGVSVDEYGAANLDAVCRRFVRCGVIADVATCESLHVGRPWAGAEFIEAVHDGSIRWHPELAAACVDELAEERSCEWALFGAPTESSCAEMYEGTRGDGEPCTLESQCVTGECWFDESDSACWTGICVGDAHLAPARIGETCGYAPCIEGHCNDQFTCEPYRGEGEACDFDDAYCDRGYQCISGRCQRLADTGEACFGNCEGCFSSCLRLGDVCGADYHCRPAGQQGDPCTWNGDCSFLLHCDLAVNQCLPGATVTGAACDADADCVDADTYCIDGMCQPPKPDGASCSLPGECESWFCDRTGTCASTDSCPW